MRADSAGKRDDNNWPASDSVRHYCQTFTGGSRRYYRVNAPNPAGSTLAASVGFGPLELTVTLPTHELRREKWLSGDRIPSADPVGNDLFPADFDTISGGPLRQQCSLLL